MEMFMSTEEFTETKMPVVKIKLLANKEFYVLKFGTEPVQYVCRHLLIFIVVQIFYLIQLSNTIFYLMRSYPDISEYCIKT